MIRRLAPDKFIWDYDNTSGISRFIVGERVDIPPTIPRNLSANAVGLTITLSWTDASDDETGFKIMRRDTLTGEYAQIGTAEADATSYEDTLTQAGTYWYRVKATNANGDSLGSNVVKVKAE